MAFVSASAIARHQSLSKKALVENKVPCIITAQNPKIQYISARHGMAVVFTNVIQLRVLEYGTTAPAGR